MQVCNPECKDLYVILKLLCVILCLNTSVIATLEEKELVYKCLLNKLVFPIVKQWKAQKCGIILLY